MLQDFTAISASPTIVLHEVIHERAATFESRNGYHISSNYPISRKIFPTTHFPALALASAASLFLCKYLSFALMISVAVF
jgi:hypothetical protein